MAAKALVVSFPKSGRTWLRVMLDAAGVDATYAHLGWGHQGARPASELRIELDSRIPRTIALFRDPRDTVVSGYYQATQRLKNYEGPISAFIREPGHGIGKVVTFNLGLAGLCSGRADCLMLTYEQLLADAAGHLRRATIFLGREIDPAHAARIAADNTFDKMQARERAGGYKEYGPAFALRADAPTSALKVRRGIAGGYRDELSANDVAYVDELLRRERYFERMAAHLG
jgi:hypothetical protein